MGASQNQVMDKIPVLEVRGVTKRFGSSVVANDHVSFTLHQGEVHALLGENGAGKSTLVKIIYGLQRPDEGAILINGVEVTLRDSAAAIEKGIGMVHQELMLIPYMTVAENVTLGQEITKNKFQLDHKKAEDTIKRLTEEYGFDMDASAPVYKLPIGVQQRVEIVKLLYRKANILILDEPTALLTPQESDKLFEIIDGLRKQGKSIIFITHKLKEVYQIADRMTVMRRGKIVATTTPQETDQQALAELMVGKTVETRRGAARPIRQETVLKVEHLSVERNRGQKVLDGVDLEIRRGEILGIAGIEGNGQTQLAQVLMGLLPASEGVVSFGGKDLRKLDTKKIRSMGVGSIPDDRQGKGLILPFSVKENLILNRFDQAPFARNRLWVDRTAVDANAEAIKNALDIRAASVNVAASTLSGGNQQKIVVGRELSIPLQLLIASQPTRGVDFASANSIQQAILSVADKGTSVLLISSDLDELLNTADRIAVMLRGKIVGEVQAKDATREVLGRLMLGVES